jgi:hypothetical protein
MVIKKKSVTIHGNTNVKYWYSLEDNIKMEFPEESP